MTIAQQLGRISSNIEVATKASEFTNFARLLCRAKGNPLEAAQMAQAERAGSNTVEIFRSAISAGTLSDPAWAGALGPYKTMADGFAESLRTVGAFDRMLADMKVLPLQTRVVVTTSAPSASVVAEGSVKPLSSMAFETVNLGPHKIVGIVPLSSEVLKFAPAAANNLIRRELAGAVARVSDEQFVDLITDGLTPTAASGTTASAILTDISTLLDNIALGSASRLFILTTPAIARDMTFKADTAGHPVFPDMTVNGGSIQGITVIPTDGCPAGWIVLADAAGIAAGADTIALTASTQADLIFDTSPNSPPTAGTLPISLWQADMVALRASRFMGAARIRDSVAVVSGGGDSPP